MRQIKNFAGLQWGSIRPTDIDVFVDFQNKLFVFIEVKYGGGMPPTGQRIALERVCDACQTKERNSFVLIAKHNSRKDEDIDLKLAEVVKYRQNGEWKNPNKQITVHEAINKLIELHKN